MLNRSWFKKFIFRYAEEIKIPYVCNNRFDLMDKEIIDILANTGCIRIQIGLESGDDFIRKKILKRNRDREHIVRVGKLCREKGIKLCVFTMIGIPFENLSRILKTVKLTAELKPFFIQTSIYYPYPKTGLYNLCRKKGFLTKRRLDSYFEREPILNLPNLSRDEILFAYDNFKNFVRAYEYI